jgi:hypothetical protein
VGNRRFEVFEYRQVLARMRQGDSDRDIARAVLMGRKKLATIRDAALQHDWLDPARPCPTTPSWPPCSAAIRNCRALAYRS